MYGSNDYWNLQDAASDKRENRNRKLLLDGKVMERDVEASNLTLRHSSTCIMHSHKYP